MPVENVSRLMDKFRMLAAKRKGARVVVGYAAPYAVFVHEDLEAHHTNGQAKFLEQPLREYRSVMQRSIRERLKAKEPLDTVLQEVGEIILSVSQPLVPVATGELRDSGFVEVEK